MHIGIKKIRKEYNYYACLPLDLEIHGKKFGFYSTENFKRFLTRKLYHFIYDENNTLDDM